MKTIAGPEHGDDVVANAMNNTSGNSGTEESLPAWCQGANEVC